MTEYEKAVLTEHATGLVPLGHERQIVLLNL